MKPRAPLSIMTPNQRHQFVMLARGITLDDYSYALSKDAQTRRARTMALGKMATLARKLHMASMNRG